MAKNIVWILVLVMLTATMNIAGATEKSETPNRVDWFVEARFGMFIHWGLYSILGGSWNGHTLPDKSLPNGSSWYAEWAQKRLEVPRADYRALAQKFNPVEFDAEQWIRNAKQAGMRYFVITAKHHDGFALWDSNVSDYDLGSTPFKRDILGELAEACEKYDIKLGFYYSHWQDWEYKGGARPKWEKQPSSESFEKYWQKKSLPQVKELLQRYDPDLLWFDTWRNASKNHITPKRRDELIALVRKESPDCLINGRICYHNPGPDIDFLETGDNRHPAKGLGRPWQTPATMCRSWGWHANDPNWKSSGKMIALLAHNASLGGNYLLNIGPKPNGTFPSQALERLEDIGEWTAANSESIYGAKPVSATPSWGARYTRRVLGDGTHRLYIFLVDGPKRARLKLPIQSSNITACMRLADKVPVACKSIDGGTLLTFKPGEENTIPVFYVDMKKLPAIFAK